MNINRPLAFLDLETTGTDVATSRIVEIAIATLMPDGEVIKWSSLVNPGCPIPVEATLVHGIDDARVAVAPAFSDLSAEIASRLDGCDLAGFNICGFDLPLLQAEFARLDVLLPMEGRAVIDAMRIFHAKVRRDLSAAVRHYTGCAHLGAHGALADATATLDVLRGQLEMHRDLPRDVAGLSAFRPEGAVDADGKLMWRDSPAGPLACLSFGKHKGHSLQWLKKNEPDFLRWMLRADFSDEVKSIVARALDGSYPQRQSQRATEAA